MRASPDSYHQSVGKTMKDGTVYIGRAERERRTGEDLSHSQYKEHLYLVPVPKGAEGYYKVCWNEAIRRGGCPGLNGSVSLRPGESVSLPDARARSAVYDVFCNAEQRVDPWQFGLKPDENGHVPVWTSDENLADKAQAMMIFNAAASRELVPCSKGALAYSLPVIYSCFSPLNRDYPAVVHQVMLWLDRSATALERQVGRNSWADYWPG